MGDFLSYREIGGKGTLLSFDFKISPLFSPLLSDSVSAVFM